MKDKIVDLAVVGGGAAGIFAALAAKEISPHAAVVVLEKHNTFLAKVRVSGGGRCNVTHACFDPFELVKNYPRGHKELIAPFHQFNPHQTIEWFENNGVKLKIEADGRMFPTTDSSATIIQCLLTQAERLGVQIFTQIKIEHIEGVHGGFEITLKDGEKYQTKKLILATGSGREGYAWSKQFGHTIQEPVPSLFTFNIPQFPLHHLSGISYNPVELSLLHSGLHQTGPVLITHFGLSGPAVLKLSAWGARYLHQCNYKATVALNWLCTQTEEMTYQTLLSNKRHTPQKTISNVNVFNLPKNLWKTVLEEIAEHKFQNLADKRLRKLSQKLHGDLYHIEGKTTNKEEFVTCGGVSLNEIDFKKMQSKKTPGLFFAGEILDIDGVTGGFNFQNAWTTGFIAGRSACS